MKKRILSMLCSIAILCMMFAGVANAQETEKIGDVRLETLTGSETEKPAENEADGSTARDAADQPAVWVEDMTQIPLNGQTQTEDKGTQTADGDAQADVQTSEMTVGTEDAAAAEMTEAGNQNAAVQAEAGDDTADTAEDRVYIPDETLRQALQGENYNVDIDEDGYASREGMEAITSLTIRGGEGLADLTGLEAAVNLNWLTLEECGIMNLLRSGLYDFLDRSAPGTTPDKVEEIYRMAFCADAYLTSSNAITEQGELFNVDGNCNRVAAMLFGPKSVIVVAGYNKIVADLEEAVLRLKKTAAPANAIRLHCATPCAKVGECMDCHSDGRICCNYLVSAQQRHQDRIKVILVGEELGY